MGRADRALNAESLRRFFRREADELTVHDRTFPQYLRLVAYHIFGSALECPGVRLVMLANYDDDFSGDRTSIRWVTCEVGHGETREFVAAGYAFLEFAALDSLKVVMALVPSAHGLVLRLWLRSEDVDRLSSVLEWVAGLENTGHPLKGKVFALTERALRFLPDQGVTRDDLVLPDDVVGELERNLGFLDSPEAYPEALRHRAILLGGEPGVGKTMIAKFLSGRFGCTTIWVTAGALAAVGPATVFDLSTRLTPTLLVLEDLDLTAGVRDATTPLGDLLGHMDGFTDLTDVAVVATTNFPELVDAALNPERRPGRFHRLLMIEPPDDAGRLKIIRRLLEGSTVVDDMPDDLVATLVEATAGQTGAQLTELWRELESRLLWERHNGGLPSDTSAVAMAALGAQRARSQSAFGFSATEVSAAR